MGSRVSHVLLDIYLSVSCPGSVACACGHVHMHVHVRVHVHVHVHVHACGVCDGVWRV